MSILSDSAILAAIRSGDIEITPFDPLSLGPNSYDVHLSPHMMTYLDREILDCRVKPVVYEYTIRQSGYVLYPGRLYLASTVEKTATKKHVPYLDGKSSIGRLGIFTHITAGRGDIGFSGHWTLELVVVQPVKIYAGMPIGQITFHTVEGEVMHPYDSVGHEGQYTDAAASPRPQPSRMWRNRFFKS